MSDNYGKLTLKDGKQVLEDGKMYLRDTRNGAVYQYEASLAQMSFVTAFTHGADDVSHDIAGTRITLSGLERGALYDRLAGMTPEARETERANLSRSEVMDMTDMGLYKVEDEAPAVVVEEQEPAKKQYRTTDIAEFTIQEYITAGWTKESLLAKGLIEEVPE
jgi:hypothetical protein